MTKKTEIIERESKAVVLNTLSSGQMYAETITIARKHYAGEAGVFYIDTYNGHHNIYNCYPSQYVLELQEFCQEYSKAIIAKRLAENKLTEIQNKIEAS